MVDQSKGKKEQDLSLIDCWNCRDKGHFRSKCPKLKKSTTDAKRLAEANSNPKGDSGPRTASAVEETSDKEGAWAAYKIMNEVVSDKDWFEQTSDNDSDMPEPEEVSNSDEEGDEVMPELVELSDSEDKGEDGMDIEEDIGMPELVELSDSNEEGDGNLVENMVILVSLSKKSTEMEPRI